MMDPKSHMVNCNPLNDMNEWKHKEEVAYWKSLATSLFYEKKMLENHIRDIYVDLINKQHECTCNVTKEIEIEDVMSYSDNRNVEERSDYNKKSRNTTKTLCVEPSNNSNASKTLIKDNVGGTTRKVTNCSQNHGVKQRSQQKKKLKEDKEVEESYIPVSLSKKRSDEMKELYGSHKSQIAGVETALQLNFERARSQLKPSYWPELQLNLG